MVAGIIAVIAQIASFKLGQFTDFEACRKKLQILSKKKPASLEKKTASKRD
jgi:hypothetical protein